MIATFEESIKEHLNPGPLMKDEKGNLLLKVWRVIERSKCTVVYLAATNSTETHQLLPYSPRHYSFQLIKDLYAAGAPRIL